MRCERDSNIAVDLTETVKEETVIHRQSSKDQTLCASLLSKVSSRDGQGSAGLVSRQNCSKNLGQVASIQSTQFDKSLRPDVLGLVDSRVGWLGAIQL